MIRMRRHFAQATGLLLLSILGIWAVQSGAKHGLVPSWEGLLTRPMMAC